MVAGISGVVMAVSAVGAGYAYSVWTDVPVATDLVGQAVLSSLEPIVPGVFALFVGLFALAALGVVYSLRSLRPF
jgi:hypothetical protein